MNNSSTTDVLQRLSDEKATLHIPAFIFIGLLMFTGFIGNVFACYFYGCKTKVTPTSCFIVGLAILDLITCSISMPMEIVDIRFFYTFPNADICKLLRTVNIICTISSVFILVAIATERYRRICNPFRKQITVLQAKLICVISILTAVAISWPGFLLFNVETVELLVPGSDAIHGHDCTTVKAEYLRSYLLSFSGLHVMLFIFSCVSIIVLYLLIYRQLIRGKKFRQMCKSSQEMSSEYKNSPVHHDSSTVITISSGTCKHNNDAEMKNKIPKDNTNVDTTKYCIRKDILFVKENYTELAQNKSLYNEEINMLIEPEKHDDMVSQNDHALNSIEFSESVEKVGRKCVRDGDSLTKAIKRFKSSPQKMSRDATTDKYTTIMFLITVIFILSFLPYLCLAVWQSFSVNYIDNQIKDWQLVLFTIGVHSYFLNSASNPFIYGLFNSQFREFIASVFVRAFRCRKDREI